MFHIGHTQLLLLAASALAGTAPASAAVRDGHAGSQITGVDRCETLSRLRLKDTTLVSATAVTAETSTGLNLRPGQNLPPFCRVIARVRSAPGSDVGVEVWLPMDGWSGVFHGVGNGGFGGTLSAGHASMAGGLRRGFVAATTDTGTAPATSLDGDPLIGQPRKWKDWGRLSTHVMTNTGKAVAKAFYGRSPNRSYYTGCSTGGQQGLIEALYYPSDYDGVLVGAPVINRTWGHAAVLWDFAAAHRAPGSLLSEAKLKLLNQAALSACGRVGSGLPSDPFIADPFSCRFDPGVLTCKGEASDQCLTSDQVATARAFYAGPTTRGGRSKFFGWLPGSEAPGRFGWPFLQSAQNGSPPFSSLFKWVFGAQWDWRGFDLDRDMAVVDNLLGDDVNDATRGSMRAFEARGGKLIMYHGLADTLVPPGQTVAFYDRVARQQGGVERTQDFARLFLAPGVMHCGGGTGPDSFNATLSIAPKPQFENAQHDLFLALIDWVERGKAPDRVVATKFPAGDATTVEMQRPLCVYPQRAIYRGSGSTDSEKSFVCSARSRTR